MSEHDELMKLAELGRKFREQQRKGRKPGALAKLVTDAARRAGHPYSFDRLLLELSYLALRREALGMHTEVLDVDRENEIITAELPRRGIVDIPFGTIRNHLTKSKRILSAEIPDSR